MPIFISQMVSVFKPDFKHVLGLFLFKLNILNIKRIKLSDQTEPLPADKQVFNSYFFLTISFKKSPYSIKLTQKNHINH